jgi:transcriptional regulator with GAF, ATPase, and Fis domain
VRELQNVVERAVITSIAGRLAVRRFLPQLSAAVVPSSNPIRTVSELEQLERDSILAALEAASWKIAGDGGAAERLGTKPSTLRSRMNALNISRPG